MFHGASKVQKDMTENAKQEEVDCHFQSFGKTGLSLETAGGKKRRRRIKSSRVEFSGGAEGWDEECWNDVAAEAKGGGGQGGDRARS